MLKVITELEIKYLEWVFDEVISLVEDLDEEQGIELAEDLQEGLYNSWEIIQGLQRRAEEDPKQLKQEYDEVDPTNDEGC